MFIIMFIVVIIFILCVFFENQSALKPNKNMILGVTLPYEYLNDIAVTTIITKYKKSNSLLYVLAILLSLFFIFLQDYTSLTLIYLLLWVTVLLYSNEKLYLRYFKELLSLKKQNGWFVGGKHLVTIDTDVSRIKNKLAISPLWFIPSLIISLLPFLVSLFSKDNFLKNIFLLTVVNLSTIFVFIYLYKTFSKQRTQVYSKNSEINLACNTVYKRSWSLLWVCVSFIHSLSMLLLLLNIFSENPSILLINISVIITSLSILLGIFYTYTKVRNTQNNLISSSNDNIYTDNDEYWEKGYYYNPNDSSATTEKRIGYGICYNMATTKGKIMTYGTSIITGVFLLVFSLFFLRLDFIDFHISVNDTIITIEAPAYGYSFNTYDIEEITLIEDLPSKGIRTNGVGGGKYSLGNFNLDTYGQCKLYIYKDNPPYIVVKLKNLYIFFNAKTPEETNRYYETIVDKIR